jgi:ATP phosphoribosyltransferase regulatory subunit
MIPWPPFGIVDRLFDEAKLLRSLEETILRTLEARGYREIIVPLLERDGVFSSEEAVRFVDRSGALLGLRPDFTGPVARVVASRLFAVDDVRLSYRGTVFRDHDERSGGRRQVQQAGFEHFGGGTVEEDVDTIRMALDVASALGLPRTTVSVGSAALIEALAPSASRDVRRALDRRDVDLLPPSLKPLVELVGDDALARARETLPPAAQPALERLGDLQKRLRDLGHDLVVDLAEVRPWSYYTGVVFSLYSEGVPRAIGAGGRYDALVGRFGNHRPGVGATFDVDVIARCAKGRA